MAEIRGHLRKLRHRFLRARIRVGPPNPAHESSQGEVVKKVGFKFRQFNTASGLRGTQTDIGAHTAVTSPSLKLAEVASSAAVLFQSQLASVKPTAAGNGNMLARFEGTLLRTLEKAKWLTDSKLTGRSADWDEGRLSDM